MIVPGVRNADGSRAGNLEPRVVFCGAICEVQGDEYVIQCGLAPGHEGAHDFSHGLPPTRRVLDEIPLIPPPAPPPLLYPIEPRVMSSKELEDAREFVAQVVKHSPPERSISVRHLCILLANAEQWAWLDEHGHLGR